MLTPNAFGVSIVHDGEGGGAHGAAVQAQGGPAHVQLFPRRNAPVIRALRLSPLGWLQGYLAHKKTPTPLGPP